MNWITRHNPYLKFYVKLFSNLNVIWHISALHVAAVDGHDSANKRSPGQSPALVLFDTEQVGAAYRRAILESSKRYYTTLVYTG